MSPIKIVPETFADYIKYEILVKQPIRSFLRVKGNNGRKLLKVEAAEYLEYRVKSRHGAHEFLPGFIERIVDGLVRKMGDSTHEIRAACTTVLSHLLVKEYPDTYHFLVIDAKKPSLAWRVSSFAIDGSEHKVAAAAAVGDVEALAKPSEVP